MAISNQTHLDFDSMNRYINRLKNYRDTITKSFSMMADGYFYIVDLKAFSYEDLVMIEDLAETLKEIEFRLGNKIDDYIRFLEKDVLEARELKDQDDAREIKEKVQAVEDSVRRIIK